MHETLLRLDKAVGRAVEVYRGSSDLIGVGKAKAGYYMCSYRRPVGRSRLANFEGWDKTSRRAARLG